jgi:outer membrane immunogenic protein
MALPAAAADLGRPITKAPAVAPVAPFSWTGCYIGGNLGWARAEHDLVTFADPFPANNINAAARTAIINSGLTSLEQDGFTGGGQVGCNWQMGMFVLGGEADINFADVTADRDTGEFIEPVSGRVVRSIDHIRQDWFATVRGRVGLAFDRILVYGTGGLAITQLDVAKSFSWDFADGCPVLGALNNCHVGGVSDTRTGWTAGGGIEWAFAPQWSLKAEYLFADFGSVSYQTSNRGLLFVAAAPQVATHSVDTTFQVVRLGVNWKFTGP